MGQAPTKCLAEKDEDEAARHSRAAIETNRAAEDPGAPEGTPANRGMKNLMNWCRSPLGSSLALRGRQTRCFVWKYKFGVFTWSDV